MTNFKGPTIFNIYRYYIHISFRKLYYICMILRYILNSNFSKMIYFSLIQSVIDFGISIWGRKHSINLVNIEVTLKTSINRILKKTKRCYPKNNSYDELFNV